MLDQFYTKSSISDEIVKTILELLPSAKKWKYIEPSAGTGNFINSLIKQNISSQKIKAYDLDPKAKGIIKTNYLTKKIKFVEERIIIGNPPFGKRGKKALKFLNKALNESPYVAMIFPNMFNRYMIQKQININAKLIHSQQLPNNSFILNGKEYVVRCVFQIWTTKTTYAKDLRIKKAPQIRHLDFQTWIHNNTKNTLKYFDKKKYGWDFASYRQGYYNYKEIITDPKDLVKNRQYFFIKAKNKKILNILKKIDYDKLSQSNTQIKGFSTSDFVKEYKRIRSKT